MDLGSNKRQLGHPLLSHLQLVLEQLELFSLLSEDCSGRGGFEELGEGRGSLR